MIDPAGCLNALEAGARRENELRIAVVIAIVDASGVPVALLRMPGSFLASLDYAQDKAWTSASFSMPTAAFGDVLDGMEEPVRQDLLAHRRVTRLPGGVPYRLDGKLLAGIGVSGGTGEQDEACANAALSALA